MISSLRRVDEQFDLTIVALGCRKPQPARVAAWLGRGNPFHSHRPRMITDESREALVRRAKEVAHGILAGHIQPNVGCSELGDICRELDYSSGLGPFGLLAHTQTDHESIGITAENSIPEILQECRNFLAALA